MIALCFLSGLGTLKSVPKPYKFISPVQEIRPPHIVELLLTYTDKFCTFLLVVLKMVTFR